MTQWTAIRIYFLDADGVMNATDRGDLGEWLRVEDVNRVFQPGVTYMPVPCCATCRWWARDSVSIPTPNPVRGECDLFADPEFDRDQKRRQHRLAEGWGAGYEVDGSGLRTHETFGCVQHEPKQ